MSFVGQARVAQAQGHVHLAPGLFPEGTELVQMVRYLNAGATMAEAPGATRIKELRHARKVLWRTYAQLEDTALGEIKDKHDFPDDTRLFAGDAERGIMQPDSGWRLQGFVEDRSGELRPQTFEETAYCMGCHGGGIGGTTDSMFAFARKLDGGSYRRGWYAPSQKGVAGLGEPKVELAGGAVHYEYTYYLLYTHSGSDLLANAELHDRFFSATDTPNPSRFAELHDDVSVALLPSPARAMALNKAYKVIVDDQSFEKGREPILGPATRMLKELGGADTTGIDKATQTGTVSGCFGPRCQAGHALDPLDDFAKMVEGAGMAGPDGENCDVDWQGIIHKSRYANSGVPFSTTPRPVLSTAPGLCFSRIPVSLQRRPPSARIREDSPPTSRISPRKRRLNHVRADTGSLRLRREGQLLRHHDRLARERRELPPCDRRANALEHLAVHLRR